MDGRSDNRRPPTPTGIDRRRFLGGAAATVALFTVGCSGSDGGSTAGPSSTTTLSPRPAPELSADPFSLGVASGDPLTDRVILWTRLAPEPLADDGLGGMPDEEVDLVWEVATDADFADIVAEGVTTAIPAHAHAVHVDATGLAPGSDHHYRFRLGDWTSPVGRARTSPEGSPERLGIGVVNCQMFETGHYGAYRHLVEEDIEVVLHLGDYIYEYDLPVEGPRAVKPDRVIADLADYRIRYASYKSDPYLQAAHARFPFIVTWDDHEVANNYMDEVVPGTPDGVDEIDRRTAAYQAWWEHLPVRLDAPDGPDLPIYRDFAFGDLARIHMLDERQHADLPPCRPDPRDTGDEGDCDERLGEDRTRLGDDQEAWLEASLAKGGVTWNLLGNPVVLAGIDTGDAAGPSSFYLDSWDGFPQARQRLIAQLADVSNPVVFTGDFHAGMVLDVHAEPFAPDTDVVAPEFMAPPISSVLFPVEAGARTPHLREALFEHGYLTVDATPERLTATFRVLDDVGNPDTAISTASTWRVEAGNPVAVRA